MDITVTELPQSGENQYKLDVSASSIGPLVVTKNDVSPDGLDRILDVEQNSDGTNPVETETFTRLSTERNIVVSVYSVSGEKVGGITKIWE